MSFSQEALLVSRLQTPKFLALSDGNDSNDQPIPCAGSTFPPQPRLVDIGMKGAQLDVDSFANDSIPVLQFLFTQIKMTHYPTKVLPYLKYVFVVLAAMLHFRIFLIFVPKDRFSAEGFASESLS